MNWKQITITDEQKFRFQDVIKFVGEEPKFKDRKVKHSDAFELLLQLFETSVGHGMNPYE